MKGPLQLLGLVRVGRAAPSQGAALNDRGAAYSQIQRPLFTMQARKRWPWYAAIGTGLGMCILTWFAQTYPVAAALLTVLTVPYFAAALAPSAQAWMRHDGVDAEARNRAIRNRVIVITALVAVLVPCVALLRGGLFVPISAGVAVLTMLLFLALAAIGGFLWTILTFMQDRFGRSTIAPSIMLWRVLTFVWGGYLAIFVVGPLVARSGSDWELVALKGVWSLPGTPGRVTEQAMAGALIAALATLVVSGAILAVRLLMRATTSRIALGPSGEELDMPGGMIDLSVSRAGSAGAVSAAMGTALSGMGHASAWQKALTRTREMLGSTHPWRSDGGLIGLLAICAHRRAMRQQRLEPNADDLAAALDGMHEHPQR